MAETVEEMELMDDWYRGIGSNITWYRRQRGMTQENLADCVNISRAHLAAIEAPNSRRRPSMDLLFRIAIVLEVSPDDLLRVQETPPHTHTHTHTRVGLPRETA